MKRVAIASLAALLVIATGVAIAGADMHGWRGCSGHRWGHFGPMAYVAHELKLTNGQKQQIHALWETEHPAISGMVREFAAESKEMDQTNMNGNIDENKAQEIAAHQGAALAKLLVEKEHFESKIYTTVLTPEQRTKADELQSRWHEHLDHLGKF